MKKINNSTNIYFRLEPVYNLLKHIESCNQSTLLLNNTGTDSWFEFFTELDTFEDTHAYNYKKSNLKTRKAVLIEIMIPNEIEEESCSSLAKDCLKLFDATPSLPSACFLSKKGKGRYLIFLFSERYYSEEGFLYTRTAKKDLYRSLTTGKMCNSNEPTASLFKKAGDTISTHSQTFSKKTKHFIHPQNGSNSFDKYRDRSINALEEVFKQYEVPFEKSMIIHRADLRLFPIFKQYQIRSFNKFLKHIEDSIYSIETEFFSTGMQIDSPSEIITLNNFRNLISSRLQSLFVPILKSLQYEGNADSDYMLYESMKSFRKYFKRQSLLASLRMFGIV